MKREETGFDIGKGKTEVGKKNSQARRALSLFGNPSEMQGGIHLSVPFIGFSIRTESSRPIYEKVRSYSYLISLTLRETCSHFLGIIYS